MHCGCISGTECYLVGYAFLADIVLTDSDSYKLVQVSWLIGMHSHYSVLICGMHYAHDQDYGLRA